MTQRDTLQCVHEPLGDAFYYGPERMSSRFENDEDTRAQSGFGASTYQTILDRIEREGDDVCSTTSHYVSMLFQKFRSPVPAQLRATQRWHGWRAPAVASIRMLMVTFVCGAMCSLSNHC